jgi:uncharacterized protein YjiS (DUF1127 family)
LAEAFALAGAPPLRLSAAMNTLIVWIVSRLGLWHQRRRQRRDLLTLDDRLLHDIGVSRADALEEASKPCWRG